MGGIRTAEQQRAYRLANPEKCRSGSSGRRTAEEQRIYRARCRAKALDTNADQPPSSHYIAFRNYVVVALVHYCVKIDQLPRTKVKDVLSSFKCAYPAYLTYTMSEKKNMGKHHLFGFFLTGNAGKDDGRFIWQRCNVPSDAGMLLANF